MVVCCPNNLPKLIVCTTPQDPWAASKVEEVSGLLDDVAAVIRP